MAAPPRRPSRGPASSHLSPPRTHRSGQVSGGELKRHRDSPSSQSQPSAPSSQPIAELLERGSHRSAAHLNFTRDARTPGGSPGRGACSREAAGPPGKGRGGKLGRKKKKSNGEVTHQPGSEVTSPCRATRAQSERASTPGPTAAVRRRRRRGSPPVSKGPIRAGGVAWSPAPRGFLPRRWTEEDPSPGAAGRWRLYRSIRPSGRSVAATSPSVCPATQD